jgi:hypothetical protein
MTARQALGDMEHGAVAAKYDREFRRESGGGALVGVEQRAMPSGGEPGVE